jgi:hypothetical protein
MTEPDETGAAARARVDIRVQVLDDLTRGSKRE